jgi:hypothetical protein
MRDASVDLAGGGRMLWEACRLVPDEDRIRACAAGGAGPALVVPAAMGHGLAPMLRRALEAAGAQDWLGDWGPALEQVAKVRAMEAALLLPQAVALALEPLCRAGMEPVVLKGPALAVRYPAPGLRPMEDLDVLLPAGQHAAAITLLEKEGWYLVRSGAFDRYDTVLRHPGVPALALELHYGIEARYKRVGGLDPDRLWRRRAAIDCMGTPAFGLEVTDELVFLAQHAGKPFHSFNRLIWIADLAVVVGDVHARGCRVDWEGVVALAAGSGCATTVAAAMAMARRIGVDVPDRVIEPPAQPWRAATLVRLTDDDWPLACDEEGTFPLRFALSDSRLERLGLVVGSRFIGSETSRWKWVLDMPRESASRANRWVRSVRSATADRRR